MSAVKTDPVVKTVLKWFNANRVPCIFSRGLDNKCMESLRGTIFRERSSVRYLGDVPKIVTLCLWATWFEVWISLTENLLHGEVKPLHPGRMVTRHTATSQLQMKYLLDWGPTWPMKSSNVFQHLIFKAKDGCDLETHGCILENNIVFADIVL